MIEQWSNDLPPAPEWVNESAEEKRARQEQWIRETTEHERQEAIAFAHSLNYELKKLVGRQERRAS